MARTSRLIFLSFFFVLCTAAVEVVSLSAWAQESPAESTADGEREPAEARRARGAANRRRSAEKTPRRTRVTGSSAEAAAGSAADEAGLAIEKIVVKGNKKIETDAITARLVSRVGDSYALSKVRQDVEALFKAGYFYDVQVDRVVSGGKVELTYVVTEKPSIAEIRYDGNQEVEGDDIKEAAGLKVFEILNMNKVREATEKIQKLYEEKGYFLARISPRIEEITAGESVRLIFDIQENEKVKVKRITFLGNKNLPDGRLKSVMATQEGGYFSFISGSGAYKQDAFDRDIQVINYAYFNEGYVQVKVDRPQVFVTPDKKGIYITIRIEEGERFKVGTVDFAGDMLFDRDELFKAIEINGSGWYVHETLLKDLRTLQAKYGDLGYAYANIIPRTRMRDKDKEVDITFEVDKGNKVYFGRINAIGNSRTRDKVIRRELAIREGEIYNETRKRESIDNVKRLGYFDEVNFNSKTPADNPDVMDIDIVVKERNTGTIQVGAGYSTFNEFIFNGQVNQINLFGRGQRLGVMINVAKNMSDYNLNFTEPHFFDTNWSVGFDAYQTLRQPPAYKETKTGGAIRIGHPLAPFLNGFVRYKLDRTQIDRDPVLGDPAVFPTGQGEPGSPNGLASSMTFTLEYDKRNDRFAPTKGLFASGSLEYAGLGGDLRYTKGIFTGRFYEKVFWEFVFRNNFTYGFIRSNSSDPNALPPYNELFLLGGAYSLRGYDWFSIGRRKFSQRRYDCLVSTTPDPNVCGQGFQGGYSSADAYNKSWIPYGGAQQIFYNAELEFPLISEAGIKGVFFYDIGEAEDQLTGDALRQDVGFGFRWFSPIGPLRFEWGFPLGRLPGEQAMNFQFSIGSPF